MYSQERLVDLQSNAQRLLEQLASSYCPSSLQLPLSGGINFIFARGSFSHYCGSVSICAITLLILYAALSRRSPTRRDRISESRRVLQALLYILAPTRSLWPQPYVYLVQKAIGAGKNTLQLPLRVLVNDILDGRIELRASKLDLPGLQRNAFLVDGWTFGLRVEWALWVDMLAWALTAQMVPSKSEDYFVKVIEGQLKHSLSSSRADPAADSV
ncbi:hypothetical protein DAEQUDRAFT_121814 [Daedalea quercina L-15889]|uniref:Uncharacterized protein n=1 Tax=Daedalea quercina L-15889 TaxID=1314783 RepID=A0A165RX09_9APHY|nr:hypothetical protein DAEQUDRAFT_121814 [Daedalea quercina L-15889]